MVLLTCGSVCDHIPEPLRTYWLIALPWWFTDMWSGLWSPPMTLAYLLTHCTSLTVYWHVDRSVITPLGTHTCLLTHCSSLTVYWHVERSVITPQNPCILTDSLHFPDGLLTCGAVCDHPPPRNPHIITDSLHFPDGLLTCGVVCDHILRTHT